MRHLVAASLLLSAAALPAAERQLSYTHGSEVLAPTQKEIEVWGTLRSGRDTYYRAFDNRLELEYGVADNVQTAVYLNFSSVNYDPTGLGVVERDSVNGVSWEWKWKLSDPVADAIGSALYFEPGISGHEIELEVKGILDKRFGSELVAFNATLEPEWEQQPDQPKPAIKWELDLGWSHQANANVAFGLEARVTSVIAHQDTPEDDGWKTQQVVVYGGPTLHLAKNGVWGTLTVMPQLFAPKAQDGNSNADRERIGAEDYEVRGLVGMSF